MYDLKIYNELAVRSTKFTGRAAVLDSKGANDAGSLPTTRPRKNDSRDMRRGNETYFRECRNRGDFSAERRH